MQKKEGRLSAVARRVDEMNALALNFSREPGVAVQVALFCTFPAEMPGGLRTVLAENVERKGLWSGFPRRTPPMTVSSPFPELLQELRCFFEPVITNINLPEGVLGHRDSNGGRYQNVGGVLIQMSTVSPSNILRQE